MRAASCTELESEVQNKNPHGQKPRGVRTKVNISVAKHDDGKVWMRGNCLVRILC